MKVKQLSSGVVVVRGSQTDYRYLILRAYNRWDFPKGLVEKGEEPLDAARREANEETGLTDLKFRWGYPFYETEPYGRGKVARYYLAQTPTARVHLPISPELGRPEHHEFRWVSYGEGRVLLVERVQAVLDWAQALTQQPQETA
jgi:bis(5'-nucleosidyl)-tetraphosphatase